MSYIHTRCNGIIDSKSRQCTKCNKHWGFFNFWFNNEVRPAPKPMQERINKANRKLARELARIKNQGGLK